MALETKLQPKVPCATHMQSQSDRFALLCFVSILRGRLVLLLNHTTIWFIAAVFCLVSLTSSFFSYGGGSCRSLTDQPLPHLDSASHIASICNARLTTSSSILPPDSRSFSRISLSTNASMNWSFARLSCSSLAASGYTFLANLHKELDRSESFSSFSRRHAQNLAL